VEKSAVGPFLGAGVSLEYGLPPWGKLVLQLLFEEVADLGPLRQIAINYRRAVSDWLANYFDYGPTFLARLIEDHVLALSDSAVFLKTIQKALYANVAVPSKRNTLKAVADLIAHKAGNIPAVVTFNFDDLLEKELSKRQIKHRSVYSAERIKLGSLPIIHAHGYIPQSREPPLAPIVFTERDYHTLTEGVFHWALTEIVSYLRHRTVLFVGLSMSDPNLRRLLDASLTKGEPPHYQLQRKHQVPEEERQAVLQELERSAQEWRRLFRGSIDKQPNQLFDVLRMTLTQADSFDTQLFRKMGVNTIWLDSYDQIPQALREITKGM